MDLIIQTLTGTEFQITVSPVGTIETVKNKIQKQEGMLTIIYLNLMRYLVNSIFEIASKCIAIDFL